MENFKAITLAEEVFRMLPDAAKNKFSKALKKTFIESLAEDICEAYHDTEVDYSWNIGDRVLFSYMVEERALESDWHVAEIVDFNWAYRCVAIRLVNSGSLIVTHLSNIKREK